MILALCDDTITQPSTSQSHCSESLMYAEVKGTLRVIQSQYQRGTYGVEKGAGCGEENERSGESAG